MTVGRISIYSTYKIEVFALIEAVFELKMVQNPHFTPIWPQNDPGGHLEFREKNFFHEIFVELDNIHQCTKFGNRMIDIGKSARGAYYRPAISPGVPGDLPVGGHVSQDPPGGGILPAGVFF